MTQTDFRPLERADISELLAWVLLMPLWQRYNLTEAKAKNLFEQALRQEDLVLLATEHDSGGILAFAYCQLNAAFGRSAYLRMIGIRESHQGQGLGTQLIRELENRVLEHSQDMFLLVSDFNTSAQAFYRRQGYEHIGKIAAYVLPDVDELLFRKRLRQN